jgi:hypothetical protein
MPPPQWPSKLTTLALAVSFTTMDVTEIASLSAMTGRSLLQAPNLTKLKVVWIDSDGQICDHPSEFFEPISEKLEHCDCMGRSNRTRCTQYAAWSI